MKLRQLSAALSIMAATTLLPFAGTAQAQEVKVTLSGAQEVPAAKTSASGSGTVTVRPDMTVTASITTTGVTATAAHIHMAPAGQNGPVIVPFVKSADGWSAAPGAKLNEAQYAAFKAGNTYVNVHSAAYPGGEIRGQIKP